MCLAYPGLNERGVVGVGEEEMGKENMPSGRMCFLGARRGK